MKLSLLQYNNYYNRRFEKMPTYEDYMSYQIASILNVNFKKGDGINTYQIVNMDTSKVPDYALYCKNDGTIISRWFVIDAEEVREGQFKLSLHRDVIADNWEKVINSTAFIEKATLSDSNPLIFNSENMTFNQIKRNEKLLMDDTQTPWIVGYFTNNTLPDGQDIVGANIPTTYDLSYDSWNDYPFISYLSTPAVMSVTDVKVKIPINSALYTDSWQIYEAIYGANGIKSNTPTPNFSTDSTALRYNIDASLGITVDQVMERALAGCVNKTTSALTTEAKNKYIVSDTIRNNLLSQVGKIIRIGTTESTYQYFRIGSSYGGDEKIETVATTSNLFATIKAATTDNEYLTGDLKSAEIVMYESQFLLTKQEITPMLKTTMLADRQTLSDAPYCMFCMPYETSIIDNIQCSADTFRRIASAITAKYSGSSHLYDIQLLPYCPFDYGFMNDNIYTPSTVQRQAIEKYSEGTGTTIGYIYWCNKSSFTRNIPLSIPSTEPKIESQTEFIRLQSPNYNGSFDFIPAKNGGIDYFNIDATYKPYTPYIHVSPNFKGLYGSDFNDARGLICGGDFSFPNVSDQFSTYELNNKNYLNTFNRQIESMDMKAGIAKTQDVIGAITGAIGGGASVAGGIGIGANSLMGGIIGGAVAGAVSLGAGLADVAINDKLRREDVDLTRDMFGFSLGNIQARANTLNKVGAQNINYKFFPFVEFYSATDEEKNALRAKIKYNGMTVGVIGLISEYLLATESFIKAQIIRADDIKDDFIMIKEISNELNKGGYMKK